RQISPAAHAAKAADIARPADPGRYDDDRAAYRFGSPPRVTGIVLLRIVSQNNPRKTSSPPRVTMKAGMPVRTISSPIAVQTSRASSVANANDAAAGQLPRKTSTAATPPIRPTPDPADRSIWPGMITRSIPRARTAVTASPISSIERLRAARNPDAAPHTPP